MITLFGKTGCPYTAKAVAALDAHGISYTMKNIKDQAVADELVARGGKRQVPYLIDGDVEMYESDEIVAYIEKTYGSGGSQSSVGNIRIHKSDTSGDVCISS